ncbi:MAG: hypothetical protein KIT33_00775 [Candidatus Kapabacteria bacterium]|nr:hypothetical protein [Ignavibacteriota bacterium]MCW5883480.1 hypothetical protein [Candidatus Kapabacteria bacterium]
MKIYGYIPSCIVILFLFTSISNSQKVDFLDSDTILEKFPDVILAQKQIQCLVEGWKQELDSIKQKADSLESQLKKNHLIWNDTEVQSIKKEIETLRETREEYARTIFEPNGKYDEAVKTIFLPISDKIKVSERHTD